MKSSSPEFMQNFETLLEDYVIMSQDLVVKYAISPTTPPQPQLSKTPQITLISLKTNIKHAYQKRINRVKTLSPTTPIYPRRKKTIHEIINSR